MEPVLRADTASFRDEEEPEKEVDLFSLGAAPGGKDVSATTGREAEESIDFRPDSRRWALVAKPESECVGVVGDENGESALAPIVERGLGMGQSDEKQRVVRTLKLTLCLSENYPSRYMSYLRLTNRRDVYDVMIDAVKEC